MINRASGELRRLLCEVETQMEPPMEKVNLLAKDMKIKLPEKLDVTNGYMQYRGIFRKCTNFLKKGQKVLFRSGKKVVSLKGNRKKAVRGKKNRF